jgi:hypothetical protein
MYKMCKMYLARILSRKLVLTVTQPGVDVMITIFCDFRQFSAKKLALFSKTNVMIKILHNICSFVFSQKRQFFGQFFGEKV